MEEHGSLLDVGQLKELFRLAYKAEEGAFRTNQGINYAIRALYGS